MTLLADTARSQKEMTIPSDVMEGLTFDEYEQMYEALQHSSSVTSWIRRGSPLRDVECMEVGNAIKALQYHAAYQKVRNSLMTRHGLSEHELVSKALTMFAISDDGPSGSLEKR